MILLVAQGLIPLLTLYITKLIIDSVSTGISSPDKPHSLQRVLWVIAIAGGIALAGALLDSISSLVGEAQSQAVTDYMHNILHAKAIEADLEYYENTEYQDTLHRAQQEAPFRPTRIMNGLMQLGQNGVSLLGVAAILVAFSPVLALLLLVFTLPGVLVKLRFSQMMYRWREKRTITERQAEYFTYLLTLGPFAKEIRLFGLGPEFMGRFRKLREIIRLEKLSMSVQRSTGDLAVQGIGILPVFVAYFFIARQAMAQEITLGAMVMYFQAIQRGQGYLQAIMKSLTGLYEDNLFLSSLYEFLDLKKKVTEPANPKPFPEALKNGIVYENVSFNYPMTDRKAIKNVSLTLRPREIIALVGENGSGKTTLVKLLCRLYDPTSGRITVDGTDLRQFETTSLRSEISVIFQDYVQYHLTARENIWIGNLNLSPDHEKIYAAARRSGADDVISGLSDGYDTVLGRWLQHGEELSVGEWQKVALARAFLRDSQIIVLDEPTSSMDPKAEYEIFEKFRKLIDDRAAILISHRLSTVRMADCIYVMDNGEIAESGTHEQLMNRNGVYAKLFERQASQYQQ
jgi:ATP-binding cassette subfamily B protein